MSDSSTSRVAQRNAMAQGLDREALRYLAFRADRLLFLLNPAPGARILDVCAGTGAFALGASQAAGNSGRVTAIDIAEGMLARLEARIAQFGISNVDVHVMDSAHLDFRRDYFTAVVCAPGLSAIAEVPAAVREWWRVLRPGGTFLVTASDRSMFQPYANMLLDRLAQAAPAAVVPAVLPWLPYADEPALHALLAQAGFDEVTVRREPSGYHLPDAAAWWEVVLHSELRALVEAMPRAALESLRVQHLADVAAHATADGLWLDTGAWIVRGKKPAGGSDAAQAGVRR